MNRKEFIKLASGTAALAVTGCVSVLEWGHATVMLRTTRKAACCSRLLRIQKDRYADQLKELADIVRGIIPNPDLYDHDIAVHKVTLMASGAPI